MTVDERFTDDYLARRQDTALLGKRNPIVTGPVSDWATDFSHLEPEWAADPYPILDDLRERCPIAHTDRFGGGWLPTRYEDVAAVAYDTENFTSRSIIMSNFRPPKEIEPIGTAPPISSDPPFHPDPRKLLLPPFPKTAVRQLAPATRAFRPGLSDASDGKDADDAAHDSAQPTPMRVIAHMLGYPLDDGPQFREFVENALEGVNLPPEERIARMRTLGQH